MNNPIVLIVEDDADLRSALIETLESASLKTVGADSADAALRVLATQPVDLVCSDVNMPGMNGIELLGCLQKDFPALPVILMTAFGSIEHSVSAMRKGARDYLVKPFGADLFISVISKYLVNSSVTQTQEPVAVDGNSRHLMQLAAKVAASDATVLVTGESGTGKEVLARYVHDCSPRSKKPFVAINCAAIPENMLEATLFGYEKGAFTGAHTSREGKFELAEGGTLLLDEISEMDLGLQAKILRVIQEREVERLGGKVTLKLDVRIVATSNRDLKQCVADGTFREDLYYRLSVFPMRWLPLRERRADILPIAKKLLAQHCLKMGRQLAQFDRSAETALTRHDWPGNVRELDNTIQRALVIQDNPCLSVSNLALDNAQESGISCFSSNYSEKDEEGSSHVMEGLLDTDLKQREFDVILGTLKKNRGKRKLSAEILGISARTLRYKLAKMREIGIDIEALLET